ncbi:unnamed protein product, partial [Ectocarpus sp. 8 AP-2014]
CCWSIGCVEVVGVPCGGVTKPSLRRNGYFVASLLPPFRSVCLFRGVGAYSVANSFILSSIAHIQASRWSCSRVNCCLCCDRCMAVYDHCWCCLQVAYRRSLVDSVLFGRWIFTLTTSP